MNPPIFLIRDYLTESWQIVWLNPSCISNNHWKKIQFRICGSYKIVVVVTTQSQLTIKPTVVLNIILYQLINKYYVVSIDTSVPHILSVIEFLSTEEHTQMSLSFIPNVESFSFEIRTKIMTTLDYLFVFDDWDYCGTHGLLVTFTHFCLIKIFQKVCNIKTKQDYTD